MSATRGDQAAIIYDSPVTNTKRSITYAELQDEVATLAAVLQEMGVVKGDRVVIYMPMIPETSFAMLACARIGAIHSVVFGGFAAKELATRIDDAKPKVILSASCGIEGARVIPYKPLLDEAITLSTSKPEACLVFQRPQLACALNDGRDRDWTSAVDAARAEGRKAECVPVAATDPLYVLYTSGTTGMPKGVVRDNGGHMVALKWSMGHFFGVKPGEVFWAASDVGWVVGHSYIVYGPLLHGCTAILYEGKPVGTPDAGAYWRVISEHGVVTLFTAPTAFRAIKKEDPKAELLKTYDLSSFRALFLAGERADPDTVKWAEDILQVPVIDHWWQTETGWPVAGNPLGLGRAPREARLSHGADAGLYPRGAGRRRQACRAQHHGRHRHQAAAASRARCRPSGRRTSGSRNPISRSIPATTTPRMPAISTRTAISGSWAAPTTSSTSPATVSRPAAWRRCWPPIRRSPNAP